MDKKAIALGAALLIAAGAANAELKAFKVNGETVSVAEQKASTTALSHRVSLLARSLKAR